jgi:hypothetical protein
MNGQPTNADTIADGKTWLRSQLESGADCPLCGQRAQMYRRKINSGMARSLIHIYRIAGTGWVHVSAIGARSREEGKLAYWGLLEEQRATGVHGGRAGYWRITQKGLSFLRSGLKVPKYALVYNGRVYGFNGEAVTIQDALGTKFDYNDLMNGR